MTESFPRGLREGGERLVRPEINRLLRAADMMEVYVKFLPHYNQPEDFLDLAREYVANATNRLDVADEAKTHLAQRYKAVASLHPTLGEDDVRQWFWLAPIYTARYVAAQMPLRHDRSAVYANAAVVASGRLLSDDPHRSCMLAPDAAGNLRTSCEHGKFCVAKCTGLELITDALEVDPMQVDYWYSATEPYDECMAKKEIAGKNGLGLVDQRLLNRIYSQYDLMWYRAFAEKQDDQAA